MEKRVRAETEMEELTCEPYSLIKCVLNPQVMNILNDFTEDVKVKLEASTRVKFDGTNRIIGKWQEVCEARKSLLHLISSRTSAKDQYIDHPNSENILIDQDHTEMHKRQPSHMPGEISNDPSLSQPNNELVRRDKNETERNKIQMTSPVNEEVSSKQLTTANLHKTKDGLSYGNEELCKGNTLKRDEFTPKRSAGKTTDVHISDATLQRSHRKTAESQKGQFGDATLQTTERKTEEIDKENFDEATSNRSNTKTTGIQGKSHDEATSQATEGKKADIEKSQLNMHSSESEQQAHKMNTPSQDQISQRLLDETATQKIGTCQHNPCGIRSKSKRFSKPFIQYMIKYLQKEVQDEMENVILFVNFVEKEDTALVQCCGQNVTEAEDRLKLFELYYEEMTQTLCIEEFPVSSIVSRSLFGEINYIISSRPDDKITVVFEEEYKHKITEIMSKLCALCADGNGRYSNIMTSKEMVVRPKCGLAQKHDSTSEFDANHPGHCLVIDSMDPYYWKHLTSRNESFIKKIDELLNKNHLTLKDREGNLKIKGHSVESLKKFQCFLHDEYIMLSAKLKHLLLKPGAVDLEKMKSKYPEITMTIYEAGQIILVGKSDIIDHFMNEFGITKDSVSTNKQHMVSNLGKDEVTAKRKPSTSVREGDNSKARDKIPYGFLINKSMEVFIHQCDITKLHVDAIVNAANESLSHGAGVAKAILDAAGPELEREGNEIMKKKGSIPVSETEVTSAGRLPCRKVIHAVGPRWPRTNDENEKTKCLRLLYKTFINILSTADRLHFKSIAMPPVSSGIFGVPKDEVANAICQAFLSTNKTNLKEVHVVDIACPCLSLIVGTFLTKKRDQRGDEELVADLQQDVVLTTIEKCLRTTQLTQLMTLNRTKIFTYQGDITQIKADTIVCLNDEKLSCSTGLAKNIVDIEGTEYKKMCQKAAKDKKLQPADVVSVKSNLFGLIIHAVTPTEYRYKQHGDGAFKELLNLTFHNAIKEASRSNSRCLAISPLGARQYSVSKHWVASALCDALVDTLKVDKQIQTVYIVDKNTEVLELLRNELEKRAEVSKQSAQTDISAQPSTSSQSEGQAILAASLHSNNNSSEGNNDGSAVDPETNEDKAVTAEEKPAMFSSHYRRMRRTPEENAKNTMDTSPSTAIQVMSGKSDVKQAPESCVICMGNMDNPKQLSKCKHTFCARCIDESFKRCGPKCPCCGELYGYLTGNQPRHGRMYVTKRRHEHLPGYEKAGMIVIDYDIPGGIQGPEHLHCGQPYWGTRRTAYLPDNTEGNKVLRLLRKAFDARLIFTVGQSATTGCDNVVVWNDIHHKTSITGGPQNYGYPDPTYLNRVQQELAAKGIK